MNEQEGLGALTTYFDLMSMNGGARIYRTANEIGIFNAVGAGHTTPQAVAKACGLRDRPVELLLDALHALGTLECTDGAYSLAPVMHLLAGNYRNLSDEYWDHLPILLKTGVPIAKMDSEEQSEEQYTKQVTALAWMMRPAAEAASLMLGIGTVRKRPHILDVGAGSAIWSLTLAAKDPEAQVTAVDWPAVLKIAEGAARQAGLADRFEALPGNYHEVELPAEMYDLAIVGNVTHIETPEGNKALFKKLHAALKTGGEIVVFDMMPGQPKGELAKALYALGLALRTEQGQVFPPETLKAFLAEAGFEHAEFSPLPVPPHTVGMIVAKKA